MLCLWLVSFALQKTGVSDPGYKGRFSLWPLGVVIALLLVVGWGMAVNAHFICDADYLVFVPLTSPLPGAPGSVDYALSCAWMWRATLLLGCLWVTADLVQDERWLLKLWWAIGLGGGSIALLGLLQKATGAEMMFWQTLEPHEPPVSTFFATYYYHANAGAYLNLTLPLVLGLAYRYATRPSNPANRALWLTISVIMAVAVISNTSRMGQFVAALMVLVLLGASAGRIFRRVRHVELKTTLIAIVVLTAALWAVIQSSHLDQSLHRWSSFQETWSHDARWLVARAAFHAQPQAGALGFGPGTFSVVFPYLSEGISDSAQGTWLFLHNDYLQTLMEWGWLGGALWFGLFFGGVTVALRDLGNKKKVTSWFPRQRMLLPLVMLALGGVAIHGALDFPLQISSIQLYVATYLGICWGSARWGRAKNAG
jgi:hypothetical protein